MLFATWSTPEVVGWLLGALFMGWVYYKSAIEVKDGVVKVSGWMNTFNKLKGR